MYGPHQPCTLHMAELYTKQGVVKVSKMLMKSMHRPHRQTRTGFKIYF